MFTQVFQEGVGWLLSVLIIRVIVFSVLLHLLHFGPSTADRLRLSRSFEDEQGSLEPGNEGTCPTPTISHCLPFVGGSC